MWEKETKESLHAHIFKALDQNIDYRKHNILGLPASYLDTRVFPLESSLLKDAPYLSTLVQNPNHIGVHTTGDSESFFAGTQAIERELIRMCSEDIFRAQANSIDGYVATGGTEANLHAGVSCTITRNCPDLFFGYTLFFGKSCKCFSDRIFSLGGK
jgi:hypothetical protein